MPLLVKRKINNYCGTGPFLPFWAKSVEITIGGYRANPNTPQNRSTGCEGNDMGIKPL